PRRPGLGRTADRSGPHRRRPAGQRPRSPEMSTEADALLRCIEQQSALVREFIDTLEAESALLLETTPNETLEALTARKNNYAQRLGELDRERTERLGRLGFGADRDG